MTGKVDDAVLISRQLQDIAQELEVRLTGIVGHPVAFSLFVWTDGRSNYISSAARAEVVQVLEQHLAGWKAGMPDVPAHEIS